MLNLKQRSLIVRQWLLLLLLIGAIVGPSSTKDDSAPSKQLRRTTTTTTTAEPKTTPALTTTITTIASQPPPLSSTTAPPTARNDSIFLARAKKAFQFTSLRYNASIPENSRSRAFVVPTEKMGIRLTRRQKAAFHDLRFKITSGDKDKFFKAEERYVGDFCFLVIRTRTGNVDVLNRERQDQYLLEVRAQTNFQDERKRTHQLEANTSVFVSITDTNDLNPLFYPMEYEVTIDEDMPLHKSFLRVTAEDADFGRNGEIYYSLGEKTEQFAVNPVSGVITLTRPLRYANNHTHKLRVLARDRGPRYREIPRPNSAHVTIHVRQVNLFPPEISIRHLPEIIEHSNADTYAVVQVTDRDTGPHGEIASLTIVGGDLDGYFRVAPNPNDPREFYVQVLRFLNRQPTNPQGYNLTLMAMDRGTPPRVSHKSVLVHLADVASNRPVFSREVYEVRVPEIAPVNTPVIRLKVNDFEYNDPGNHHQQQIAAPVFLEIVGGNEGGEFYINADTGMLYTAKPLDAEGKAFYTLTVSAVDQGNFGSRSQSSAKVKIYVLDTNDNDPKFESTNQDLVYINENEPAGTSITRVLARDRDSGENAYISYSIDNIKRVPFEIDPFSGIVKTRQVIDYETMKREYILYVRASDWGLPYRRQAETQLKIRVRDVNDNRPQFVKVDCQGQVSRRLPIGAEIITLNAVDFDSTGKIEYRLASGNEDGCFTLDTQTGALFVACDLQDLKVSERVVNVTASDGMHFSDINSVTIGLSKTTPINKVKEFECRDTGVIRRLTDVVAQAEKNNSPLENEVHVLMSSRYGENLHSPEFVDFPLEIRVNESAPVGYVLGTLVARDRDRGYNGKLVFGISGGDNDSVFGLQTETGELRIIGRLDRERESEYFLNISVYDLGKPQKSTSKLLPVTILDVNDNPPKFERSMAVCRVYENVPNDTIIFQARASDADLGVHAQIAYELMTDTPDFKVDRRSGMLTTNSLLDRERQAVYELKLRATDNAVFDNSFLVQANNASRSLHSEALIKVILDDVNDNPPKFEFPEYKVKTREDIPVWSVVAIVQARDPDDGPNGQVEYFLFNEIEDEEAEHFFVIDKLTGTVRTARNLDFEYRQVHNLVVSAKDRGEPRLTSNVTLVVEVIDVNENLYAPTFNDFVASATVFENQPIGTKVTQVRAKDEDLLEADSRISYSIYAGDGVGYFSVDNDGIIRTRCVLDVETKDSYWITVYAQDHGIIPRSSKLEVFVQVLDENDNVPLTEMPVYYPSVMENSPAGVSVLEMKAFDRDVSRQRITFSITSGDPGGFFLMNSTSGLITTSGRKLDRENQDEHILEITVRDDGKPPLSSTTRVVVKVDDANDHGPEFEQKSFVVHVPATSSVDKALFQVLAHDKDIGKNGKINYSIKSGKGKGKFKINPQSGMVYSQKPLEPNQDFDIVVRATDEGEPPRSHQARVSVQVVKTPKESKNPPIFKNVNQSVDVTESDEIGYLVALMQATDADGDSIWFDIIDGDPRNEFFIGRDNGNVLLAKQLDWEKQNFYDLTIQATDGIDKTTTHLLVNVIDINDHRPEFTKSTYRVQISENVAKFDESILQLHAEDADQDKRVFYSLHSAQCQESLKIFNIDSLTGAIKLTRALDREAIEEHVLTVMVRDQGTPAKRNYARVIITVHDNNDHAPFFTSNIMQANVYETADVGSEVVQVSAIDYDHGDNARLAYSIVSGNVGNVFSINPDTGVLQIARELNINSAPEYILLVKAVDHGSPQLFSSVPIHIMVTMSDNAPPRFVQKPEELAAEIYENQPRGSYVVGVQVRSTSSVQFEIVEGNKDDAFFINPTTGIVTTQIELDYEGRKFYNLTIMATNMASASATCNVLVHVLDRNDNAPKFVKSEYHGFATEGNVAGSLVFNANDSGGAPLVIKAQDADSESNALLEFEILDDLSRRYFHIDSSTGAVRTVMALDYESVPVFRFRARVSDQGKPRMSSEATAKVTISVRNINDCPPTFLHNGYNVTLLLPTWTDVKVIGVQAVDPDIDPTSNSTLPDNKIKYDIIDGNLEQAFYIDSTTGEIFVNNSENMRSDYLLHVRASDGKYSNIVQVNVSVQRSDGTDLKFEKRVYHATVQENSTKISTVAVVNVLGSILNENIVFRILNANDKFTIGSTSGVVRTTGVKFDRELRDNYELIISAESQDPKTRVTHTVLNVTVLDVNDNCPIFVNLPYYAIASVDAQKGDAVIKVRAVDLDIAENGEVRYELKKGHGELFNVNRKTGEITLKQSLEGHNKEYVLIVAAHDGGNSPCSVEVPVNIKVIDRSMPVFDKQFYADSVPENIEINSPLSVSIQAASPLDRKLIYSVAKGNELEIFSIDFNTGIISVVDELDYEDKREHELTIRATDSVSGVYAEVLLKIMVLDVNDSPPEFEHDSYNVSVSESALPGTSILRVLAHDSDQGVNQKIQYTIETDYHNSNNPENSNVDHDLFSIDPDDGTIYLKRQLDHETSTRHHVTVIATDKGIPPLSSTAHVWVNVIDVNDNPPQFEQTSFGCSLSEDSERGQFVAVLSASDPDLSDRRLVYSIVGGNEQQTYSIDPYTGVILLTNMQNFADEKLTALNVSVTDGVFTSFARVKIEILPANRHHPKFPVLEQEVEVLENQLPGQLIYTAKATDKDFGIYGTIRYSIQSGLMSDFFDVNDRSGEIVTKITMDRELRKSYQIPVVATDGGGKAGFLTLRVKVADENDNAPRFVAREYRASIFGNLTLNSVILKIKASDLDEGDFGRISYSVLQTKNSQAKQIFGINQQSGALYLKESAKPHEGQHFQFFVRAQDNAEDNPQHADVPVSIYVMTPSDVPPYFEKAEEKFFISESSPIGTPITRLMVSQADNRTVTCRILAPNDEFPFSVDPQTCKASLIAQIDREVRDNYVIVVLAETETEPPFSALTEVTLQVLDENDHTPQFESNIYGLLVAENVEQGSPILRVAAHDLDLNSNGEIRYSLATDANEENFSSVFTIDAYTGWISTMTPLDKEKRPEYKFHVVATDNGHSHHFARALVHVKLQDYNDNSPQFNAPTDNTYSATVKEDALPGTIVVELSTIDKDEDLDTNVNYYILSGDPQRQFQIKPTGQLHVVRELDRESIDNYRIRVVGTDGKFVFYTTVIVKVQDVNDNPPYCIKYRYKESLSEGAHPGSYVLTILATDYDDGPNPKLRFYLTGEGNDRFLLDKDTGVLKTSGQLDRETCSRYLLTAHVQDRERPSWECSSQIDIAIMDLNDNAPKFSEPNYANVIPEDAEVGTLVGKVHAQDDDTGINRKIRYKFLDSANDHFTIMSDSGIVRLAKSLDRETRATYNLSIQATDQGTPQLATTTHLVVNVQDINDNPPVFTEKLYHATVRESSLLGFEVMRVLATSEDAGINADINYSIIGGNDHGKFRMDTKTGAILVADGLDFERAKDYLLTVQAIDGGDPPLANHANVNITVLDDNDNAPTFGQASYQGSIREDAKPGDKVLQILAYDLDGENNNKVSYSIERGDRLKQFDIDPETGELKVASHLDREHIASYKLEIRAHDNGVPLMSNVVTVTIDILDANDNPPLFSQNNYSAIIQESKPFGHPILKFEVNDADSPVNAAPYTFDIYSGNEENVFRLDQDGTLRSASKFNSRVKDTYQLNIRVFDHGTPPLHSDTWVTVKIIEESQYPPVITPLEIFINSYQDGYPGGVIGRIHASDKDQYDTITYGLSPVQTPAGNRQLFKVDKDDGTITALPQLDVGEYRINVSASDGKFNTTSLVKVNVDSVSDEALDRSAIVRFREVSAEDFILKHRRGFLKTVRHALGCRIKDIVILSVQPSNDAAVNDVIKSREVRQTAVHNDLDVLFAVKKSNTQEFFTSENIRESLNQHVEELEASTKLVVEEIVRYKCTKSHCVYGECRDTVILDYNKVSVIPTDVVSFVLPRHRHHTKCLCKEGYKGQHCEVVTNECARKPCPAYKICTPDSSIQGYTCQCPDGLTGETCSEDSSSCHDKSCYTPRNPISFSGKSYGRYKIEPKAARQFIESQMSVSLRIRTVQPTGNLLYASGKVDYNVLELVNGALQYKFDLGSGEGVVRLSEIHLSDGHWHEVQLRRDGNSASLTVDGKYTAHGSAPGLNNVLNLRSEADLYLGAEVRQHPSIIGFEDVQRGYVGCMDDVKIAKSSVPLHMSSAGGSSNNQILVLKRFANIEFNCDPKTALVPLGICGSQPCRNGGTCKPLDTSAGQQQFQCLCHERFRGLSCEIDTDPCASSPCLYGGKCRPALASQSDFTCECSDPKLSGKRCEFGKYCQPNPCLNGGICEEGDLGPVCKCRGFQGTHCEKDINECETNNPCTNGGTCVNEVGTYRCVCPGHKGLNNCGSPAEYTGMGLGLGLFPDHLKPSWEQLIWIGSAMGVNVLLVLIFVIFRKIRSKRRGSLAVKNINNETKKKVVLNSARSCKDNDFKRTSKLSNLEVVQREPPQCPPRPASYTPSTNNDALFTGCNYGTANGAGVALNNLDTLRSYGSAGEELLENVPPEYLKNLNRCMPAPNVLDPTGDVRKSSWQEQMQLASFIAESTKINNDLKRLIPSVPDVTVTGAKTISGGRSANAGGTSIASLSSMEEDPRIVGGYHWDCSDWVRPSQNPLPNITEVPNCEIPDSSSFHSNESNESNTHQVPITHLNVGRSLELIETLSEDQEPEYMVDSESENGVVQPFLKKMQRLNTLENNYKFKDSHLTSNYFRYPNSYLPRFNINSDAEQKNQHRLFNGSCLVEEDEEEGEDDELINDRASDEDDFADDRDNSETNGPDQDDDVVPYGFPIIKTRHEKSKKSIKKMQEIGSVVGAMEERNSLLGNDNGDGNNLEFVEINDCGSNVTTTTAEVIAAHKKLK